MIVTMSLGFNEVLIAGKGIAVIHVAQFVDKVIHDLVVKELLLVDHIRALLDDRIETYTIGKFELIIVVHAVYPHSALFDQTWVGGCCFRLLIDGCLLIVNLLN